MSALRPLLSMNVALLLCAACATPSDSAENDSVASETGESGETGEDLLDSDEDGLTDAEEAELGTDPLVKDTDGDNYWDSWEVLEGSDPLDPDSRIYLGYWPYNPDKDALEQGSWETVSTAAGAAFPRHRFLDQHGQLVDIYDFANFTHNPTGEPAFLLVEMVAQWCPSCHLMSRWIQGIDSEETAGLQAAFPTVREKVHNLQVWWITMVVADYNNDPPTAAEAELWFSVHQDPFIPVFADYTWEVRANFSGGQVPFFFIIDPNMKIEYWEEPTDIDPYAALTLVDQLL